MTQLNEIAVTAIRAAMAATGKTPSDIAESIGVSGDTIRRRLNGEIDLTLDYLEQIAHAIDADPLVLIGADQAKVVVENNGNGNVDSEVSVEVNVTPG